RPPLAEHRAGDGPVGAAREGHGERHETILARDVVLPAAPGDRVTVPHQKAVAEVLRSGRIGHPDRAVEHPEGDLAAAVGHVQEQPGVAACGIDRPQHVEVRRGLDEPGRSARSHGEVRDRLIYQMRRVDAEAKDAGDLLVGARITESMSVEYERAAGDLERGYGHGMDPPAGRLSAAP